MGYTRDEPRHVEDDVGARGDYEAPAGELGNGEDQEGYFAAQTVDHQGRQEGADDAAEGVERGDPGTLVDRHRERGVGRGQVGQRRGRPAEVAAARHHCETRWK